MSTQEISITQSPPMAALSPLAYVRQQTLERVQHFLTKPTLSVYPDLKGMCERVSDSYRERVVFELLQNAHDAHPAGETNGRIKVVLDPDEGRFGTLSVADDGQGFNSRNFDALCSPTRTTKIVNEGIGNKGVGFLSVFQVSGYPEVYSRLSSRSTSFDGYCFSFADDSSIRQFLEDKNLGAHADDVIAKMPRLYLACPNRDVPEAVRRFEEEGFSTVVRLPLKSDDARHSVACQLEQLAGDGPPIQLFLTRIGELTVVNMAEEPLELSRQVQTIHMAGNHQILEVTCGKQPFVVAQQTIPYQEVINVIRRDVDAERLPKSWLDWEGDAVVSLAVASKGPPLAGRLYNFLPMGAEADAPFNGHLDAPFYASIDRLRLQSNVELNDLLLKTARHLAIEGAKLAKTHLSPEQGRRVTTDLIAWSGDGADEVRTVLLDSRVDLVPTLKSGAPSGWSGLRNVRIWKGDEYITPKFASRVSKLRIVDPAIGPQRIAALSAFASDLDIDCSAREQADVVESIALHLAKRQAKVAQWDIFYRSLSKMFRDDPSILAGRRLLRTAPGEVRATERIDVQRQKGHKRRRLSAVFLPPQAKATIDLPRAVRRRIAYVTPELEIACDSASPARRFLVAAGLVRDHENREILRLLSTAMIETGDVKNPEELRWQALDAMMKIVTAEDTADGVVSELNPLVPTREGWTRANVAYFSGRWTGTASADLERLFDEAQGVSSELDQHARRLLLPYADWHVRTHNHAAWIAFLRKAGVVDHLRRVPAIAGAAPRVWPGELLNALVQRVGLPSDQAQAWRTLMMAQPDLLNPQTPYTADGTYRLPGQREYDALGPVVGRSYAIQIIRAVEALPGLMWMSVYRPSPQHRFTCRVPDDWIPV